MEDEIVYGLARSLRFQDEICYGVALGVVVNFVGVCI